MFTDTYIRIHQLFWSFWSVSIFMVYIFLLTSSLCITSYTLHIKNIPYFFSENISFYFIYFLISTFKFSKMVIFTKCMQGIITIIIYMMFVFDIYTRNNYLVSDYHNVSFGTCLSDIIQTDHLCRKEWRHNTISVAVYFVGRSFFMKTLFYGICLILFSEWFILICNYYMVANHTITYIYFNVTISASICNHGGVAMHDGKSRGWRRGINSKWWDLKP